MVVPEIASDEVVRRALPEVDSERSSYGTLVHAERDHGPMLPARSRARAMKHTSWPGDTERRCDAAEAFVHVAGLTHAPYPAPLGASR